MNDYHVNNENESEIESDAFKIYRNTVSIQYDIMISKNVVSDLNAYFDLIQFLDNEAKETDVVNLKIANYGGDLHSGVALAHSVKNCRATTIVHVTSNSYSMAAILALCGDALCVYPGNYLMFHNYSGGEIGKAGEIETSHKANKKSWSEYLKYFCTPFLTEQEVKDIMSDKDLYIHDTSVGLKKRMKRHFPNMLTK